MKHLFMLWAATMTGELKIGVWWYAVSTEMMMRRWDWHWVCDEADLGPGRQWNMSLSKKWNIWAEGWLSCQLLYLPHYTTLLYQTKSHSDTDLHLATFMFCVYAGVGWYNAPTLLQLTPHHMWSGHPTFTLQRHNLETLWRNTYFKIIIIRRTIALPASADPSFM